MYYPEMISQLHPEGWLMDPNKRWLIAFHKDPIHCNRRQKYYMDQWSCSGSGIPCRFKNRREVEIEPALETWNELIQNGWNRVEP